MFKRVLTAILGTRHDRDLKRIQPILDSVHEHEARLAGVSDEDVRSQTEKFRGLLKERTAPQIVSNRPSTLLNRRIGIVLPSRS